MRVSGYVPELFKRVSIEVEVGGEKVTLPGYRCRVCGWLTAASTTEAVDSHDCTIAPVAVGEVEEKPPERFNVTFAT